MARARFVRPEFFTDEKVGEIPYGARLLFQSIWCQADLRGVFEYSAKALRVATFPFDEGLTSATVQEWLDALESKGMIARFEARGKSWGFVRNWKAHQTISGREVEIDNKLRPEQRRPEYPGSAQVVPGSSPGSAHAASLSLSPSPTPSVAGDVGDHGATPTAQDSKAHNRRELRKVLLSSGCPAGDKETEEWLLVIEEILNGNGFSAQEKLWAVADVLVQAKSAGKGIRYAREAADGLRLWLSKRLKESA
jgi:hypothetical protein